MSTFTLPSGNLAQSGSSSSSSSKSKQYSGLPSKWRDYALKTTLPMMGSIMGDLPQYVDQWANQGLMKYQQQLNNAVKTALPGMVNQLANRGVLSSTVASDAIGNMMNKAMQDFAQKGYDTAAKTAQLKFQIPLMAGQLASSLGRYSKGQSSSGSSSSSSSYDNSALIGLMNLL